MHVASFTSAALLTLGVSAGTIDKRNGEGVHLANCYQQGKAFSQMLYYADDSTAANGVQPYYTNECFVTGPGDGFKTWEGSQISCTFPSGTSFTSHLPSGVQWYGTGQYAGPGWNSYRNFNCYKDDGHQLFDFGYTKCYSIYYCLDA